MNGISEETLKFHIITGTFNNKNKQYGKFINIVDLYTGESLIWKFYKGYRDPLFERDYSYFQNYIKIYNLLPFEKRKKIHKRIIKKVLDSDNPDETFINFIKRIAS